MLQVQNVVSEPKLSLAGGKIALVILFVSEYSSRYSMFESNTNVEGLSPSFVASIVPSQSLNRLVCAFGRFTQSGGDGW